MRYRTPILSVALLVLSLLAVGGAVGALALSNGGMMRHITGTRMMGSQQGQQNMLGNQQGSQGMMNGQPGMMGNSPQNPTPQGTPVSDITHVTIQDYAYQDPNLQVRVGTTLTWTNQDSVPHSVTFKNGMKDSGLLSKGQSFSYMFTTPGTYSYYCSIHPYMVATITVIA